MKCLTPAQVQAVVDREASDEERRHVTACGACRTQVAARESQMALLTSLVSEGEMPRGVSQRIEAALSGGAARGATRLRPSAPSRWGHAQWGTAALVLATLVAVLFVAPALKRDRAAVSAAAVLAASATRLAQPGTIGVETLEYELVVAGMPRDVMPDHADGTYRVWQTIDHRVPGRFRYTSTGLNGDLVSSIAQDPTTGRRTMTFVLEQQPYRFDVAVSPGVGPSLPELERLHMQATIALMQASSDRSLQVLDTPAGRQYRIEVPNVQAPVASAIWDLQEARVLVDADDYRVHELDVKGTFLEQPYSVSYRLINRVVAEGVPAGTFEVPAQPGEILITGEGTVVPARDAVVLVLRELARAKQAR